MCVERSKGPLHRSPNQRQQTVEDQVKTTEYWYLKKNGSPAKNLSAVGGGSNANKRACRCPCRWNDSNHKRVKISAVTLLFCRTLFRHVVRKGESSTCGEVHVDSSSTSTRYRHVRHDVTDTGGRAGGDARRDARTKSISTALAYYVIILYRYTLYICLMR